MKHLPSELKRSDWDVLIAHFLGIDHCGHKYGPLHPEMSRKLTEMNQIIEKFVANIDDDTVLMVIGDHGMTYTGDHGGASDDEIEALLFAYSKKAFTSSNYDGNAKSIQQIDFTSTLATILGIPIPFSNLGTMSLQLLPAISYENLKEPELLLMHLWQNARQIQEYFSIYSADEGTFSTSVIYTEKFKTLENKIKSIKSEKEFIQFANELRTELDEILEVRILMKMIYFIFTFNLIFRFAVKHG